MASMFMLHHHWYFAFSIARLPREYSTSSVSSKITPLLAKIGLSLVDMIAISLHNATGTIFDQSPNALIRRRLGTIEIMVSWHAIICASVLGVCGEVEPGSFPGPGIKL